MDIGINISGAEANFARTGTTFPSTTELDYFAASGMTTVRVPLSWELMQPTLGGALNTSYIAQLKTAVSYANSLGLKVILDVHNYGSYNGDLIGSAKVPVSAFADLWGKLAGQFAGNGKVLFGLMNEPQLKTASDWLPAVNAAIGAIRASGATSQQVLISGIGWDGASTWTTNGNAAVLGAAGAIKDPSRNYAFEVHQYLDASGGGKSDTVVSTQIGVQRLQAVTAWAQATGNKLYLGEVGVASDATSLTALNNMLTYMQQNGAVWQGASYWAAGVNWNNYSYSVEPGLGILDMPQMGVLAKFTNTKIVTTSLAGGEVRKDAYAANGVTKTMSDVSDAKGKLVSRTLFDASGNFDRTILFNADGTQTLTIYGSNNVAAFVEVFNAQQAMLSKATIAAGGGRTVQFFDVATSAVLRTQVFNADGSLLSQTVANGGGSYAVSQYTGGVLSVVAQYSAANALTSATLYDAKGNVTAVQTPLADGGHQQLNYKVGQATATSKDLYNSAWALVSRTIYNTDGSSEVSSYAAGKLVSVVKTAATVVGDAVGSVTGAAGGVAAGIVATTVPSPAVKAAQILPEVKTTTLTNADGSRVYQQSSGGKLTVATTYDATGHMIAKTTYDTNGRVATAQVADGTGGYVINFYANGSSKPYQVGTYDGAFNLLSRTTTAADGSYEVDRFGPNGSSTIQKFGPNGLLAQQTTNDGHGTVDTILYNAAGAKTSELLVDAAGKHQTQYGITGKGYHTQTTDTSANGTTLDIISANNDGSETARFMAPGVTLNFANAHELVISAGGDTMIFASTPFQDTIQNFQAGGGAGHDTIVLSKSLVADFSHLAIGTGAGGAVTVGIDAQHSLTLTGIHGTLSAANFKFA